LQHTLEKVRSALADGRISAQVREIQAVEGDTGTAVFPPLDPDADVETSRTIGEFTYRFSADGFFQINHLLLPELIRTALEPLHGDTVLDLYCGVGLFSLPLAAKFESIIGIESNAAAIRYAQLNAANACFENTTFYSDMVGTWFEKHRDTLGSVDAVLLDPPRIGAEKATIRGILSVKPKMISYVSCDPATLARDLRPMLDAGYTLESVTAFDMFPQTHHVETVVHLQCC
jgi:23S rRNA (uracil1939-C5)-methyltransferase